MGQAVKEETQNVGRRWHPWSCRKDCHSKGKL